MKIDTYVELTYFCFYVLLFVLLVSFILINNIWDWCFLSQKDLSVQSTWKKSKTNDGIAVKPINFYGTISTTWFLNFPGCFPTTPKVAWWLQGTWGVPRGYADTVSELKAFSPGVPFIVRSDKSTFYLFLITSTKIINQKNANSAYILCELQKNMNHLGILISSFVKWVV